MSKISPLFQRLPLKIWLCNIFIFFVPLFIYLLQYLIFGLDIKHYLIEMIWFIYILPPILFAYYYDTKGAIISSLILQLFHLTYELLLHRSLLSLEIIYFLLFKFILSFFVSYLVGLMSKKLKMHTFELENAYNKIHKMAYYDSLTGLANRDLLMKILKKESLWHKENNKHFAILFLDLDGFKKINDEYGHDAGDLLLIDVAKRFSSCVNSSDLLSRFAGDEFIILLSEATKIEAVKVAKKIIHSLHTPFIIKNNCVALTTSIGISLFQDNENSDELIKHADIAMFLAKKSGKNTYNVYSGT